MEKLKEKLSSSGYRLTKPRLEVLCFLEKANKPYSAQEIFKKIENVDLVSVYRILSILVELNMVNQETFGKEKKYCLNSSPHHHIVCRKCGKTSNVQCNHSYTNKFEDFSDVRHKLILTGICKQCKSKLI